MNTRIYKPYLPFVLISILFIASMSFAAYFYYEWDNTSVQESSAVEITLPIINWAAYSSLSKQYEGDNIILENNLP